MKVWTIDPQSGGIEIPKDMQLTIQERANLYERQCPWYATSGSRLVLRFKRQFCYLDMLETDGTTSPIGRLRYFGKDDWSLAFYTYSNERYQPCVYRNGKWFGTIEQAIDVCSAYLV